MWSIHFFFFWEEEGALFLWFYFDLLPSLLEIDTMSEFGIEY